MTRKPRTRSSSRPLAHSAELSADQLEQAVGGGIRPPNLQLGMYSDDTTNIDSVVDDLQPIVVMC